MGAERDHDPLGELALLQCIDLKSRPNGAAMQPRGANLDSGGKVAEMEGERKEQGGEKEKIPSLFFSHLNHC